MWTQTLKGGKLPLVARRVLESARRYVVLTTSTSTGPSQTHLIESSSAVPPFTGCGTETLQVITRLDFRGALGRLSCICEHAALVHMDYVDREFIFDGSHNVVTQIFT